MVCIYRGILLSHKTEILPLAATWMGLENTMLSEISQTEKDILYDTTYVESKKKKTNECICRTETDSQIEKTNLRLPKGRGTEGRGKLGV